MTAATSPPAAGLSVPAEPDPGRGRWRHCRRVLAVGAAAVTGQLAGWLAAAAAAGLGEKAAPARKRFRNRPGRTTGCTGAIGRAGIPEWEHDMYDNDACGSGHRGRRRAQLRRAGLAAAVLALMGLLATACGGGSSHARAGGGGGVQAALAYARCMRAHGVPDFPDPDSNGQFNVDPHSASSQETAANHTCNHLLTVGGQMDQRQQELSQLVKYAQCMRAHGVPNFPDPHYTSGGIGRPGGLLGFASGPGFDLKHPSPQVQSANHACQHLLPGGDRSHE